MTIEKRFPLSWIKLLLAQSPVVTCLTVSVQGLSQRETIKTSHLVQVSHWCISDNTELEWFVQLQTGNREQGL